MADILITVGTDGIRNYFRRLDDRKTYSLGSVHVPDFVRSLVGNSSELTSILESFLQGESRPFTADEDLAWSLVSQRKYRYATHRRNYF